MFHYLHGYVLRQDLFQLAGTLPPGMRRHLCYLRTRRGNVRLRLVECQAQLAHEFLMDLLAGHTKPLFVRKAQLLQKPFILAFQFLVFCTGNRYCFRVSCLCFPLFHISNYTTNLSENPVFSSSFPFYASRSPVTGRFALGCSTLSPSMSHRYCCAVIRFASVPFRGH